MDSSANEQKGQGKPSPQANIGPKPLLDTLRKELDNPIGNKILITSRSSFIPKISLALLGILVVEKHHRGVYITIERPYVYMQSILKLRGIPISDIIFIDTVSKLSGRVIPDDENVRFVDGPFSINLMQDVPIKAIQNNVPTKTIRLPEMDFFMVDNISPIYKYASSTAIESFFCKLTTFSSKPEQKIIGIIDPVACPQLYQLAKTYIGRIIPIQEALL